MLALASLSPAVRAAPDRALGAAVVASGAGLIAALGVLWFGLAKRLDRALRRLAGDIALAVETRRTQAFDPARHGLLPALSAATAAALGALATTERERADSLAQATRATEEHKSQLAAVLRDLGQGIVICNLAHRVLLYNRAALAILREPAEIGLGRPIFNLLAPEPIEHAIELLMNRAAQRLGAEAELGTVSLACATADRRNLVHGTLGLVLDEAGKAKGYVLAFADATREIESAYRREARLRSLVTAMRGGLANLRAAAETVTFNPDMEAGARAEFQHVVSAESAELSRRLETLDTELRDLGLAQSTLSDVYSSDLIECAQRRLAERGGPALVGVGMPLWLRADAFSMTLLLTELATRLASATGARSFDIEPLLADRKIFLEIGWVGSALASATLDGWLDEKLAGAGGAICMREILERHASALWTASRKRGLSVVRMPVPWPAESEVFRAHKPAVAPRPEFYDFDLFRVAASPDLAARELGSLAYVVFDTETTGLNPGGGDEIIELGAVRIVNGRILTGETFERLVNPMRPIPQSSSRIHGIGDEMVAEAPPLSVALAQFERFCGESVLVGHNVGFDLKFLEVKEGETGVAIKNLALDTQIVSRFLWPDFDDHSLDGIALRLGLPCVNRHRALADAMVTAAVFVRMIEALEGRGVTTLGALLRASRMAREIAIGQAVF